MGMKALVTGMMMATLAGGALAQSLDPARVEMFRSILQGNECTLTEVAAANILPRFDFSREETRSIVGALVAAGEVRLDGSTLNLIDGSCGTGDPVADLLGQRDVQQFIAVMAENSCAMTEDDGERIFTARGTTKEQVGAVIGPMIEAGMVSFDAGVLTVDAAYCAAPVMAEEMPVEVGAPADMASVPKLDRSGIFGMSRVRQLVDVMAQNSCTLNMEVADGYLGEAGIEHSFAAFIGRKMLADGFASMVGSENLVLSAPYCISAGGETVLAQVKAPIEAPMAEPPLSVHDTVMKLGAREDTFLTVLNQDGCTLNVTEAEGLLTNVGLRMDQAFQIVDTFIEDGNASLSDDGALVTFDPVLCGSDIQPVTQAAPPVNPVVPATPEVVTAPAQPMADSTDPRAGLLAMLALNSCEISQSNAAEMILAAGLDFNTSMQMLTQMMGSGEAISPDGGQTLQVSAPLCVAAAAEQKNPREAFINLIKQNNCSVTASEFSSLLPVDGLDATTAFAMINELEAEGVISLPATRDVVTLSAEMCR